MVRRISRNHCAIVVQFLKEDGSRGGEYRFAIGEELDTLERAIEAAAAAPDGRIQIVGRLPCRSGAQIEISASRQTVALRWRLPTGERRKLTLIRDAELRALRRAIRDLRTTAAKAAFEEERNEP
jgi:hypothetical protein